MTLLVQRIFRGEVPRLPEDLLPENSAKFASNCDLQHGQVKGVRGNATVATGLLIGGKAVRSAYTEDGSAHFAWAYDVDIAKSQVVDDKWRRVYYTIVYEGTPLIKVARTHRVDVNGNVTATVIGSTPILGGNYQPPENSSGPDSWLLGVADPDMGGTLATGAGDPPTVALLDAPAWPKMPGLALRVTFFLETPTGEIVSQKDISNVESPVGYPQVFYTVSGNNNDRANKIQDMNWPLGGLSRPFKFYWFKPPDYTDVPVGRSVTVTNTGTGAIVITYGASEPATDSITGPPIDQA
jgi:hypothetical protein